MKKLSYVAALTIAALAVGCSSSNTSTSSSGNPSPTSTTDPGTTAPPADPGSNTSGSSGTPAPAAAAPKAPQITEIMKMMGALHVNWTNNEPSCDTIEGERQATMSDGSIMEKYKVVFSVPGEADNKMDSAATDNMKYTYRLRCKKGTTYSAYSNEMSANPTQ